MDFVTRQSAKQDNQARTGYRVQLFTSADISDTVCHLLKIFIFAGEAEIENDKTRYPTERWAARRTEEPDLSGIKWPRIKSGRHGYLYWTKATTV